MTSLFALFGGSFCFFLFFFRLLVCVPFLLWMPAKEPNAGWAPGSLQTGDVTGDLGRGPPWGQPGLVMDSSEQLSLVPHCMR